MNRDRLLVIGGSAGSLQVVLSMLLAMGREYPLPVILILHRNSSVESYLEDLLSSRTRLVIREVEEKEVLKPGTVYVCPADYHVLVERDRSLSLDYSERVNHCRPSIDVTMRSAADVFGAGLVAVLSLNLSTVSVCRGSGPRRHPCPKRFTCSRTQRWNGEK